jgi:hypothetical protein
MVEITNKPTPIFTPIITWKRELDRIKNEEACIIKQYEPIYKEIIDTYQNAADNTDDEEKKNACFKKIEQMGTFEDYVEKNVRSKLPPHLKLIKAGYEELLCSYCFARTTALSVEDDFYYLCLASDFPSPTFFGNSYVLPNLIKDLRQLIEDAFKDCLNPRKIQKPEILALKGEKIKRMYSMDEDAVDANSIFNLRPITEEAGFLLSDIFSKCSFLFCDEREINDFLGKGEEKDLYDTQLKELASRMLCSDTDERIYLTFLKNSNYSSRDLLDSNIQVLQNGLLEINTANHLLEICDNLDGKFMFSGTDIQKIRFKIQKYLSEIEGLTLLPRYLFIKDKVQIYERAINCEGILEEELARFSEAYEREVQKMDSIPLDEYKQVYMRYEKQMEKKYGKNRFKQVEVTK